MANVEKLSVTLTEAQAKLVRHAVKSGEFATTSEVIREALRAWQSSRRHDALTADDLRRLWREGLASGQAKNGPAVIKRLEKRFSALRPKS